MSLPFRSIAAFLAGAILASSPVSDAVAQDGPDVRPDRGARFDVVSQLEPGSSELYGLTIDSVTRRAFVLDSQKRMVRVYDISTGVLTPAGTVNVGTVAGNVYGIAVNEIDHEVYVTYNSSGLSELVVIDADPASPRRNTITSRGPTGGVGSFDLGTDPTTHRVFVLNGSSEDVSVFDLDDGSRQIVPLGDRPRSIAVDAVSGTAVVSSYDGKSLTTLKADGSRSDMPLEFRPLEVEIGGGQLFVATNDPFAAHLEAFDLATMSRAGASPALPGPVSDITVDVERHTVYVAHAAIDAAGITAVRTGDLSVQGSGAVDYYGDLALDPVAHRLVGLQNSVSSTVLMIEPHLSPLPAVDRIGGADRFSMAAAVSSDTFASGVPVAYVASGTVFADALSAGAAAGLQGGPVLLVTRDTVPTVTTDELTRLRPGRIVIVGGTATVGADVETALSELGKVTRTAGADRYIVSAAISAAAFPKGSSVAYVASGEVFPDALSASPLAGREAGPVLLTQGASLPASIGAELKRLKPQYVYVLGGPSTVGTEVVKQLEATATVIRIDGADRFAVAAAASARMFRPSTYTVYVASGAVFPDALAGAPAAIAGGAPILLVTSDSIPSSIDAELRRLAPYRIVLLGGANTVSDRVAAQLEGYLPD